MESIDELRRICRKDKNDSWYPAHFARKISIYFTKLLLYTPITANQATLLVILIGIAAVILFSMGGIWYVLSGALVLQLCYIFDHVDGNIARYKKVSSLTGAYFDFLSDLIVHAIIFAGIAFGV